MTIVHQFNDHVFKYMFVVLRFVRANLHSKSDGEKCCKTTMITTTSTKIKRNKRWHVLVSANQVNFAATDSITAVSSSTTNNKNKLHVTFLFTVQCDSTT